MKTVFKFKDNEDEIKIVDITIDSNSLIYRILYSLLESNTRRHPYNTINSVYSNETERWENNILFEKILLKRLKIILETEYPDKFSECKKIINFELF